jgi:hypothetical protein
VQNADRSEHNRARVHQGRVIGVGFARMQISDSLDLNAYLAIVLYIGEELSLVIGGCEDTTVAAFIDVEE